MSIEMTRECVTRQQVNRPGHLEEFLQFWSANKDVRKTPADRQRVVTDLMALQLKFPKLEAPRGWWTSMPSLCRAALVSGRMRVLTHHDDHFSRPEDEDHAVSVRRQSRLLVIPVGSIFERSFKIGAQVRRTRPVEEAHV